VTPPQFVPMPLVRIPQAFDDADWVFELKFDGFRALAFIEAGECRLVSRNGHAFRQFTPLAASLARRLPDGIYDGEIVALDRDGRSQFNQLLFRRCTPVFAAFDLLGLDGTDLRALPLVERKRRLRAIAPRRSTAMLYVQHVQAHDIALFNQICDHDLEGIVGKWACGTYICDGSSTSWIKVKNPRYSQAVGRRELFDGRGHRRNTTAAKMRRLVLA
jgi:bifunctional non-homologous end joining protein LigD